MYYKVLVSMEGELRSSSSPNTVKYVKDRATHKPVGGGPLAVFATLGDAHLFRYATKRQIWECDVDFGDEVFDGVWSGSSIFDSATHGLPKCYLPNGTVLVSSVTIRKCVYPEVDNDPASVE